MKQCQMHRKPAINTTRCWPSTQGVSVHFRSVLDADPAHKVSLCTSDLYFFKSVDPGRFVSLLFVNIFKAICFCCCCCYFILFGPHSPLLHLPTQERTFKNWLGVCLRFFRVLLNPPFVWKVQWHTCKIRPLVNVPAFTFVWGGTLPLLHPIFHQSMNSHSGDAMHQKEPLLHVLPLGLSQRHPLPQACGLWHQTKTMSTASFSVYG